MSAEFSPSTAAHFSSSWKQFSMPYSIPFSCWSSVSIVQDHVHPSPKHTHMHTQTMGGTVLIAFCTALKGWPPGFCSPSIGFIMAAVHPSSCCIIPATYFGFSWLLCEHSPAPSTLNLSPCGHLSYHQRSLSYYYEHSTTCLLFLHLPPRLWVTSQQ